MKKTLSLLLLLMLFSVNVSSLAWAESGSRSNSESNSHDDEDSDDEDEDQIEDDDEDESENEDSEEDEDEDDRIEDGELPEELEHELDNETFSGEHRDHIYVSVEWGDWDSKAGESTESTTWDGSIVLTDAVARPHELLDFERGEDALDHAKSSKTETAFTSVVHGNHDGILLKIKSDLEKNDPSLKFVSVYQNTNHTVKLETLMEKPEGEILKVGNYEVHFKASNQKEWLEERAEERKEDRPHFKDSEQGSWYENYMNYSVDEGFFSGFKDDKGELTGEIRPGSTLTRFQAIKVLAELSEKLKMGLGERDCEPETVTLTTDTEWMKGHWARGYVQCIQNSDLKVTLLDEVMKKSVAEGEKPALRWEVVSTAFELLGVETTGAPDTTLSDVHSGSSNLKEPLRDMIDEAVVLGVVSGYPEGDFRPYKEVNRAEMFKITTLFYETLSF